MYTGGNKFLSPEKSTSANRLSNPKVVAVVRPFSSENNDEVVTTVVSPSLIVSCEELFSIYKYFY